MSNGSHFANNDPRNATILVHVNGELLPRAEASVSVFDSGFLLGDGVWEGLRVHQGRIAFVDEHLDRLFEGAKALDMQIDVTRAEIIDRIEALLSANGMSDGIHLRLMVTRGIKSTPYQDPRLTEGSVTIVIIPEYKSTTTAPVPLSLFTVHVRRGGPDVQDAKWNSHSKLNCIAACIQATKAGADEALMLDPHGFVATCNSTNFFVVRKNEVWTSTGKYCVNGITRRKVLELCDRHGIPSREIDFSLTDVYGASEAFVTGTFGGLTPVASVDGRDYDQPAPGPVTQRLRSLYQGLVAEETS